MTVPSSDMARWLSAARTGSSEALGQMLETCRAYLLLIAGRELDVQLRAKGGASDLVQETLLEAFRDFAGFHGDTEQELLAWLRQLLFNNLSNFSRRYLGTAKRGAAKEVPLGIDDSANPLRDQLIADDSTPSARVAAEEQAETIHRALQRLPPQYQQVILLRYQEELPFAEIGERMGRSSNAAEKLWMRAIERLQHELEMLS